MARFFTAFPKTVYNNQYCVDLIRSTHLTRETAINMQLFYNVETKEGERPDVLAYNYYDDSFYDWLVYYANQVTDPYFGWYMTQRQFDSFVADQYGSVAEALEKITHYKVNYVNDTRQITSAEYQALSIGQRKYWRPREEFSSAVYVRKELDWQVNTNMVVKLTVSTDDITQWIGTGMYVHQLDGLEVIASGEVVQVDGNTMIVQNITGTFVVSDTNAISAPAVDGMDSANIMIRGSAVLRVNIPPDEASYWVPETAYDYEEAVNENKKTVRLINKTYLRSIQENHENTLSSIE